MHFINNMRIINHLCFLLLAIALCKEAPLYAQGAIATHGIVSTGHTSTDSANRWVSYSVGNTAFHTYGTDTIVEEGFQHVLWRHILHDINSANIEIFILDEQTLSLRPIEGKNFVRYRWYRDGQIVAEGPDMHIYHQGNGVPLNGCYHLDVITSTGSQQWQHSDTICIETSSITEASKAIALHVCPNPAPASGTVTISIGGISTLPAPLAIVDANGRTVARHSISSTIANIALPSVKGIYLLRLEMPNGSIATSKLIVQ